MRRLDWVSLLCHVDVVDLHLIRRHVGDQVLRSWVVVVDFKWQARESSGSEQEAGQHKSGAEKLVRHGEVKVANFTCAWEQHMTLPKRA